LARGKPMANRQADHPCLEWRIARDVSKLSHRVAIGAGTNGKKMMEGSMEGRAPAVSVLIPTYNQAAYLPAAIESVLQQTWSDLELIVVNDGSTDQTRRVLRRFESEPRIRITHQENKKLPGALNTGLRQARGEFLTWTSSDNLMLPTMLETLVKALRLNPEVSLVYADWELINRDANVLGVIRTLDYDPYLLMRTNYINACFLYRRICQDEVGFYNANYLHVEDWEYWLRLSERFQMMHVPQVLYQYRVHPDSLTSRVVLSQAEMTSGQRQLIRKLRSRRLAWWLSKIKWEWLRLRMSGDPRRRIHPHIWDRDFDD
jgi:glycosyltransferase involved in cell wall biosynthesis